MRTKSILTLTLISLLTLALPAKSHDLLVEIEPADGAKITTNSFEAVLTFNNPILVVEGENNAELAIKLVGSDEWVDQPVRVDGSQLFAQLSMETPGEYNLRWKVVSSDGHPITGESTFLAEFLPPEEPAEPEEPVVIAPNPNEGSDPDSGSLTGFYIGLAMVALGAVFAPIGLMMRRKAKRSRA